MATIYKTAFKAGLKPDQVLTITQWADQYRMLPKSGAKESGRYRSSRTPYFQEVMDELSPESSTQKVVVMKSTQIGAPLWIETPVPTPSGWTNMEDLNVGDKVFNENGVICSVLGVSEVFKNRECYEITFSDKSKIVCDAEHLWTVTDERSYSYPKQKTLTTLEISKTLHACYQKGRNRYAIPVCKPLVLKEKDLPINSYALGCWLGDGSNALNQITQHKDDADEMAKYLTQVGHPSFVRHPKWIKGNCRNIIIEPKEKKEDFCIRGHDLKKVGRHPKYGYCKECNRQLSRHYQYGTPVDPITSPYKKGFYSKLKKLNLLANKHIPSIYLRASYNQRLLLLQGLMDTDGCITKNGRQELSFVDPVLVKNSYELLMSLGIKASIYIREAGERIFPGNSLRKTKEIHRLSFFAYADKPVFKLKRKLDRMVKQAGARRFSETNRRRIVDVKKVESVPVKCISVDSPSNLFLCGNAMIPTHNTEAGTNLLMFVAHISPGPVLCVFPTDSIARKHSKKKIAPSIKMMPCLKGIIKEVRSRDSGNTILEKDFPGGSWAFTGSNSPVSARHESIRYLVLDDFDGFVMDVGGEGDPADLFAKRTDSFGSKRKIYINSTPTIAGISGIEREYKTSSQGTYHVPCPYCKEFQYLKWGGKGIKYGIKFTHDEDNTILDIWYVCKHCKKKIKESDKEKMLSKGKYVHKYPNRLIRGFKINSLYSPLGWVSWSQIAKEFLDINKSKEKLKVFVNTRLAETFEEIGDQPEWPALKARAEPYDMLTMPTGGMILTAGVDVQDDRLVVVVRAWGRHEESWLVYYGELWGDPDKPEAWAQLDKLLLMNISDYHIISCAVDTGGHRTQAVYNYCRFRAPQVIAIKGASQPGKPVIGRPTKQDVTWNGEKISNGVELWPVGSDVAKSTIYSRLRQAEPGPKTYHWPIGLPDEYYLQLTAEKQITKYVNGYPKLEWIKVRERNDVLDCENYAYSAAIRAGMALYDWDKIEDGMSSRRPSDPAKKKAVVRKPVRSSWMS